MKIIFLDFDGVMDTSYYDHVLSKEGKPGNDNYGTVFDPFCIRNLKRIIDETGADIVVSSSWKYIMSYQDLKWLSSDKLGSKLVHLRRINSEGGGTFLLFN